MIILLFTGLVSSGNAQAQDTTPPVVTSISVSSAAIDVSSQPYMLEVSVMFTDDLSGFSGYLWVKYVPPSGDEGRAIRCALYPYTGGSALRGFTSGTAITADDSTGLCTWNVGAEAGHWQIAEVEISDLAGNEVLYCDSRYTVHNDEHCGEVADFSSSDVIVTSGSADTTPPVVTSISVSSAAIDVSSQPYMLEVSVMFTDDLSGFSGYLWVTYVPPSGDEGRAIRCALYPYTGGSALRGSTSGTAITADDSTGLCTWNVGAEAGRWQIAEVEISDLAGNEILYCDSRYTGHNYDRCGEVADFSSGDVIVTTTADSPSCVPIPMSTYEALQSRGWVAAPCS